MNLRNNNIFYASFLLGCHNYIYARDCSIGKNKQFVAHLLNFYSYLNEHDQNFSVSLQYTL